MNWFLGVTYMDAERNEFLHLGGAVCKGKRQRDEVLADIPVGPDDSPFILDIENLHGIIDDRLLSVGTVERLLKKPTALLIEEAYARAIKSGDIRPIDVTARGEERRGEGRRVKRPIPKPLRGTLGADSYFVPKSKVPIPLDSLDNCMLETIDAQFIIIEHLVTSYIQDIGGSNYVAARLHELAVAIDSKVCRAKRPDATRTDRVGTDVEPLDVPGGKQ